MTALLITLLLGVLAVSGKFSQIAANSLLVAVWIVGMVAAWRAGVRDVRLLVGAASVLLGLCLLTSKWIAPTSVSASVEPQSQSIAAPSEPARPATLRQLFENDWPSVAAYYEESVLKSPAFDAGEIKVSWRLNGDFAARSRYLLFFFDMAVSPHDGQAVCEAIAQTFAQFIATADASVDVLGKTMDDTAGTHFKDMVFSRRIFIYYGNPDFSLTQKGALEALHKQRGLSVQFRDQSYAWSHQDSTGFRKEPVVPNSVLLPSIRLNPNLLIQVTNLRQAPAPAQQK